MNGFKFCSLMIIFLLASCVRNTKELLHGDILFVTFRMKISKMSKKFQLWDSLQKFIDDEQLSSYSYAIPKSIFDVDKKYFIFRYSLIKKDTYISRIFYDKDQNIFVYLSDIDSYHTSDNEFPVFINIPSIKKFFFIYNNQTNFITNISSPS